MRPQVVSSRMSVSGRAIVVLVGTLISVIVSLFSSWREVDRLKAERRQIDQAVSLEEYWNGFRAGLKAQTPPPHDSIKFWNEYDAEHGISDEARKNLYTGEAAGEALRSGPVDRLNDAGWPTAGWMRP